MDMTPDDYVKMVDRLNSDLYDNDATEKFCENYGLSFGYTTDGFVNVITIMDFMLWNDDNEDREYNEETDEWEPLEPFIRRKFAELVQEISLMKLNEGDDG